MEKTYRLYSRRASFFDLIEGDKETQQTKGLGLLLAKSNTALKSFLSLEKVKQKIGIIDWSKIDQVIVNAELTSKTTKRVRADIVIRFYAQNEAQKILIIEAKSAKKNISAKSAESQLNDYITNTYFDELKEFDEENIHGITLTKYSGYLKHRNFISISWSDIIHSFYYADKTQDALLNDYFYFLTNIRQTMNFYEREVFSIPTSKTSNEAVENYHIYECPNKGRYVIKQKPLYLTFRRSRGGEMDRLYKVDDIIHLNFKKEFKSFLEDENYSKEIRDRVANYVNLKLKNEARGWDGGLPNDEKQVFILSKKTIELQHNPKPQRNNSFRAYYKLSDLLDSNKKIVEVEKDI